jgi:hypothetical protein
VTQLRSSGGSQPEPPYVQLRDGRGPVLGRQVRISPRHLQIRVAEQFTHGIETTPAIEASAF